TVYTLSCYVRSADPGRAWIGGSERWRIRFHFKPTGNKWMRIVGTFKTNPTERNFHLMILTESPTSGIWIDDVQLEEGDKVTAFQMPIKLKSGDVRIVVERAHVNPNLVPNSSFEEVHGNRPHHWMWDRRNTDATMTVDETIARSGKRSIKLTNGTPFGAHVYGWFGLVGSIPVKPNTAYTVSCYVRTEGAGIAWIGGGKRWRIRAMFPRVTTGGRWVRVWKSFVTEPDEKTFALMIVTESPTKGIWIDDVKFEEGDRPTPYVPDFEKPHPSLELELPPPKSVEHRGILFMPIWKPERYPIHEHVFAGEQVWLEGLLYLPERLGRAQLRVLIERTDTGEVVKRAMHEYDFDAGAYDVEIGWGCADADLARYRIRAWLEPVASKEGANVTATGQRKNILASAQLEFYLYSRRTVLAQIEKVRRMLAQLDDAIAKLQRRGEDTSYPQVTASIVRDFIGYALEDVNYGEVGRAWDAGVVMERLLRDELVQIENVLKGKA
ncbi:MAG TPA: hypothetical protein EYP10_03585, partial [Armatimonadetes bacterium]|nr:hypothetical protein [Armatimonadota bacterium]